MRSRYELEQILRRKGVPPEVGAPILDRLTEAGLVDDMAFARAFVASRQRTRPRGRMGLVAELKKRGIDGDVIDAVLDDWTASEDPVDAARRAVAPKLRSLAGKPAPEVRRKAEQFLLRRGFGFETAREVLRDLPEEDP
jgi:regulatory protein